MATTTAPAASSALDLPRSAGRVTFAGALRSEFTKIRSVRSTYWTLLAMFVVVVGFGALASTGAAHGPHGPYFDPTRQSLAGLYVGQLIIGVLGVLVITSEYSTGMIRTTLTTNPHRGVMIAAKGVVFTVVALVTSLLTSFAAFFLGQALMSSDHISTTIGSPNVLRAVIGGALFLTACGVLAFGLGLLIRHSAGGIGAMVGLLFVVTILVNFLPQSWQNHVDKWVPALAGGQLWMTQPQSPGNSPMFGPWTSFAILCGYAAIAVAAAMILFRKRDA
ncbi:MAG TPA: ABC transporter permease [Streptosporangiaceae bacterium]|jgi:ABC-type transport system involved in multi-copper enzyme maturation permease subunit|nr:ABC transporter permease [Streptosporangiaceae bacterium]HEX2818806.1 ABC transporter permease [Streptosporangiaceae bacterium]